MSSYLLKPKFGGSKVLYLNSANATSYIGLDGDTPPQPLSTHYTYSLPDPIVVPDSQKCLVSLYNATIPNTFYTIRKGENDLLPIYFRWCNDTTEWDATGTEDRPSSYPAPNNDDQEEAPKNFGGEFTLTETHYAKNKGKQGSVLTIPAGYYTPEELAERVCAEVEACPLMSGLRQTQWFYPWEDQTIAEYNDANTRTGGGVDDGVPPNQTAAATYISKYIYNAERPPNPQRAVLGDYIQFGWRWDQNRNRITFYCGTRRNLNAVKEPLGTGYPYGLKANGSEVGPTYPPDHDTRGGFLPTTIPDTGSGEVDGNYQYLFPTITEVGFMFGAPPDDWFQNDKNAVAYPAPSEIPMPHYAGTWIDNWASNYKNSDPPSQVGDDPNYPWFNRTIGPALGFYDNPTSKHIAFYPNNWQDYNTLAGGKGHYLPWRSREVPYSPGVAIGTEGFEYYQIPPFFISDKGTHTHRIALSGEALAYEYPKFVGITGYTENDEFLAFAANTCPRCPDPEDGIHGLFVNQNLVSNSALDNTSGVFGNTLGRIPISAGPNKLIIQRPSDATHQSLVDLKTIDSIELQLTDDRNRPIDLNGLDWQVGILIQFVENVPEDTTNLSRSEIENSLIDNTKVLAPSFQTELPEEEGRDYLKRLKASEERPKKTKGKTKN